MSGMWVIRAETQQWVGARNTPTGKGVEARDKARRHRRVMGFWGAQEQEQVAAEGSLHYRPAPTRRTNETTAQTALVVHRGWSMAHSNSSNSSSKAGR